FFSSRRRHTRFSRDWSSDVCSSDLGCPVSVYWFVKSRRDRAVRKRRRPADILSALFGQLVDCLLSFSLLIILLCKWRYNPNAGFFPRFRRCLTAVAVRVAKTVRRAVTAVAPAYVTRRSSVTVWHDQPVYFNVKSQFSVRAYRNT